MGYLSRSHGTTLGVTNHRRANQLHMTLTNVVQAFTDRNLPLPSASRTTNLELRYTGQTRILTDVTDAARSFYIRWTVPET